MKKHFNIEGPCFPEAASKPRGRFLELGTGTGVSACWLLEGMDENSILLTVELEEEYIQIAKKNLGQDKRVKFCTIRFLKQVSEGDNTIKKVLFRDSGG